MAVTHKSGLHGSRRKLLIVVSVILAVVVLISAFFVYRSLIVDDDDLIRVKSASELRDAVNNAEVNVPINIALTTDIFLGPELTIPAGADITLTSDSKSDFFRLIGLNGQGVIRIMNGGRLTLAGIIVTHEEGSTGYGIHVGGRLIMIDGEVSGNINPNGLGGVVVDQGGIFELVGGLISGNTAERGAGVYNGGTFKMSGGEISGNTAVGTMWNLGGGGVFLWDSWFEMSGGVITNNTAQRYGGGVYNLYGTFDWVGGEIYDNTAGEGNDVHERTE